MCICCLLCNNLCNKLFNFNPAPGGQRTGSQSGNTKKGKSIKFNGEFDFESSNARFDKEKIESELKSEIERMKISSQDEEVC